MTTVDGGDGRLPDGELEPAPLIEVAIELASALQVRIDRCVGDVPMLEVVTGRARVLVSVDAGDPRQLGAEHVTAADAFAQAACALHDEVKGLVVGRDLGGPGES